MAVTIIRNIDQLQPLEILSQLYEQRREIGAYANRHLRKADNQLYFHNSYSLGFSTEAAEKRNQKRLAASNFIKDILQLFPCCHSQPIFRKLERDQLITGNDLVDFISTHLSQYHLPQQEAPALNNAFNDTPLKTMLERWRQFTHDTKLQSTDYLYKSIPTKYQFISDILQTLHFTYGFTYCMCPDFIPSSKVKAIISIIDNIQFDLPVTIYGIACGALNFEMTLVLMLRVLGFRSDITLHGIDPGLDPKLTGGDKFGFSHGKTEQQTRERLFEDIGLRITFNGVTSTKYFQRFNVRNLPQQSIFLICDTGGASDAIYKSLPDLSNIQAPKTAKIFFGGSHECAYIKEQGYSAYKEDAQLRAKTIGTREIHQRRFSTDDDNTVRKSSIFNEM
ncbi:hypothetical protein [Fangia hongkongensis]|uniref:hypothetical protein n=1 Tax=Fangia hongkongensis TaxID=270495 RepID=UPI00036185FD|nr:hypothetical protein [Fangia hongkongensis]MBK2125816.1 hypothetical protein [Fangia hongkongensis]